MDDNVIVASNGVFKFWYCTKCGAQIRPLKFIDTKPSCRRCERREKRRAKHEQVGRAD